MTAGGCHKIVCRYGGNLIDACVIFPVIGNALSFSQNVLGITFGKLICTNVVNVHVDIVVEVCLIGLSAEVAAVDGKVQKKVERLVKGSIKRKGTRCA